MKKILTVDLYAPSKEDFPGQPCSFWHAPPEDQARGCGPGEGVGDAIVPDKLFGLSIRWPCAIHDWMYKWGKTREEKQFADRVLKQNMFRVIDAAGGWLKNPRKALAWVYYGFVKYGGEASFWNAKHEFDLREVVVT